MVSSSTVNFICQSGRYGLSAKCIAEQCGVEVHTVRNILHRNEVKLRDYRDGHNDISKKVISRVKLLTIRVRSSRRIAV